MTRRVKPMTLGRLGIRISNRLIADFKAGKLDTVHIGVVRSYLRSACHRIPLNKIDFDFLEDITLRTFVRWAVNYEKPKEHTH